MSEFNKGATYAKDVILATIIGLQNGLGNDESNPKYQAYQELYELISDRYGADCQPFKG